ncbi:M23 family metallopeptidase [Erythrobacter alti]|uniref:M23 family metallopeptidase n=1 Tax=Erythrobacter alti TaxID=1896145 RepID=UPI0030F42F09
MLVKITSFMAAATMLVATPALADDAATTGAIDTSAVASADVDSEFTELFASWETLENGGSVTATGAVRAAPRIAVSVPSRMPVDGVRLTSGFGMRDHPILRRRARHNGVDLAAPRGTPVYATADGIVEMAQYYSSYGNYVQIGHGSDIETRYAHLSSYTVSAGEQVRIGDLIGYVGSTGRSTGPHLHYEVRVANDPVNPIPYMVAQLEADEAEGAARGGPE